MFQSMTAFPQRVSTLNQVHKREKEEKLFKFFISSNRVFYLKNPHLHSWRDYSQYYLISFSCIFLLCAM